MINRFKRLLGAIIIGGIMFYGCVSDDTIHEIYKQQTFVQEEQVTSAKTDVCVANNAINTTLLINGYSINDDKLISIIPTTIEYKDTVTIDTVYGIGKFNKVLFDGKIISNGHTIYEGEMYTFPNDCIIELYPNCPWYDENGNKILNSIEFDININNWKK